MPVTYIEDYIPDIGRKRLTKLTDIIARERRDAGMISVMIGLKELNQMHGIGLERTQSLCRTWEAAMKECYLEADVLPDGVAEYSMFCTGRTHFTDELKDAISDLSDRKSQQIIQFTVTQRIEAGAVSFLIGMGVIRNDKRLKISRKDADKLKRQWFRDISEFYSDRELYEPRLKLWMQKEIGIDITDINTIRIWHDSETDKCIKKEKAEKENEEYERKEKARQAERPGEGGEGPRDDLREVPGNAGRQGTGKEPVRRYIPADRDEARNMLILRQAVQSRGYIAAPVVLDKMPGSQEAGHIAQTARINRR